MATKKVTAKKATWEMVVRGVKHRPMTASVKYYGPKEASDQAKMVKQEGLHVVIPSEHRRDTILMADEITSVVVRRVGTKRPKAKSGTCSECGCADETPCAHANGSACGWANKAKTLCTCCAPVQATRWPASRGKLTPDFRDFGAGLLG